MATTLADVPHVQAAIDLAATHYLTKPFRLRELTERVEAILRQHPRRAEDASPSPGAIAVL